MLTRILVAVVLVFITTRAQAVPSFAAQTGQACQTCHIGSFGPQLTPFGREFKIEGYTMTGGEGLASKIPLSAMVLGSFTNTAASQPEGAAPHFGTNNTSPSIRSVSSSRVVSPTMRARLCKAPTPVSVVRSPWTTPTSS